MVYTITYLNKDISLQLYYSLIRDFGGEYGIFDEYKLLSCLFQPTDSYYGQDQYPSLAEKAAVYLYSIVTLHPFVDGNKRAGYTYACYFLMIHGYKINATDQKKINFVLEVASNSKNYEQVLLWIKLYMKGNSNIENPILYENMQDYILHSNDSMNAEIYELIIKTEYKVLQKLAE